MKTDDVRVGETYLARISGQLTRVVVLRRVEPTGDRWSRITKFAIRREGSERVLDKLRAASALRPVPPPAPPRRAPDITDPLDAVAQIRAAHTTDEARALLLTRVSSRLCIAPLAAVLIPDPVTAARPGANRCLAIASALRPTTDEERAALAERLSASGSPLAASIAHMIGLEQKRAE